MFRRHESTLLGAQVAFTARRQARYRFNALYGFSFGISHDDAILQLLLPARERINSQARYKNAADWWFSLRIPCPRSNLKNETDVIQDFCSIGVGFITFSHPGE